MRPFGFVLAGLLCAGVLLTTACSGGAAAPASTPGADAATPAAGPAPVKITAAAGQTASGTFTLDTPGTCTFECSMPLHAAAGMRGTIEAT